MKGQRWNHCHPWPFCLNRSDYSAGLLKRELDAFALHNFGYIVYILAKANQQPRRQASGY